MWDEHYHEFEDWQLVGFGKIGLENYRSSKMD
jgi:hypothetical protein